MRGVKLYSPLRSTYSALPRQLNVPGSMLRGDAAIVPSHAHVETRARQADAPIVDARHEIGEGGGCVAGHADRGGVGEDLHAARPVRQKGQHLLVIKLHALHAHDTGQVVVGRDVVVGKRVGIEGVVGKEIRSGLEHLRTEEILVMPPESTDGDVSDLLEIIFRANLHRIRTPRFDSGVVHGDTIS